MIKNIEVKIIVDGIASNPKMIASEVYNIMAKHCSQELTVSVLDNTINKMSAGYTICRP